MAIKPETPWSKATKSVKPSSDSLDLPIGERLTRFRTEQQGNERKNKFDRAKAAETEAPLDDEIRLNIFDRQAPAKIRIQTRTRAYHTLEDQKLTQARLNEESRRLALKNPPKGPANFSYSDADWAAILQGWKARHSADYVPTPFNGQNLGRMIAHQCAIGQLEWNSESLTVCHQWLAENGYYEPSEGQRKRGQAAPKVYPQHVPEQPRADNSLVVKTRTTMTEEENTALRTKNFDDLAAEARSLNKKQARR
jgi:hypothetical protein